MSEEDINELKRLFYSDRLTQYGKRKLISYYEQQIKELEENSIPVSLVEETIEELGNMTLLTVAQRQEVSYAIAVLQELLEKRK